ncbi:hypothetical protein BC826DRAFT_995444 [Russula brevipes]|nr:hypothetical protein BC826DRAFT_995444 [Russula brevipes]
MQNAYPSFHESIPLFLSTHASIITGMAAYSSLLRYCDFLYLFRVPRIPFLPCRAPKRYIGNVVLHNDSSQVPACIS